MLNDQIDKAGERPVISPESEEPTPAETPQDGALFMTMFLSHPAVMLLVDSETGGIIDATAATAEFYGWPVEQLRAMNIREIDASLPEIGRASCRERVCQYV